MPTLLKARWLFTGHGAPLAHAEIAVAQGRILGYRGRLPAPGGEAPIEVGHLPAGHQRSEHETLDLGQVLLLPGLVNAHTHLEFSHLSAPLGQPGQSLPDWIAAVLTHRTQTANDHEQGSIAQGLAESLAHGVTRVGDIAQPRPAQLASAGTSSSSAAQHGTAPTHPFAWQSPAPAQMAFLELLGLAEPRRKMATAAATAWCNQPSNAWYLRGLSPHAPYSTHWELLELAVRLAQNHGLPLAMHLAESPEEMELLAAGTGPFRRLLAERGQDDLSGLAQGQGVLPYLQQLSRAPRALVIHGNYLSPREIEFLAAQAERLAVVYCPRTHGYFAHPPHPLPRLLAAGARVALGTDSRASNPDLDLWAELRQVCCQFPELSPAQVLELGTRAGAEALGCRDEGMLAPGYQANLLALALPAGGGDDPLAAALNSPATVMGVCLAGLRAV